MGQKDTHAPATASLFDNLVSEQLHRIRHLDTEGLRGLHVDHQLELARSHHRKITGLLALENAADKVSC